MEFIEGGVTTPKGFMAASAAAGIKYKRRQDMAMIHSEKPCNYAATFTRNVVKAAPVKWDMDILHRGGKVHTVVVNSGIANAATGDDGMLACIDTADFVSGSMGVGKREVLVASTGVIGMPMPMDRIKKGIGLLKEDLSSDTEAGTRAAEAIMTTDTHKKEVCVTFNIGESKVSIGGMAKGSGMIHPDMCTMLAFLTTDCSISAPMLQKALSAAVNNTFNMVSVDGDTSTNDTCLILSNGEAGNTMITAEGEEFTAFSQALLEATKKLAMMIAGDGEGATALLEVKVINADSDESARILAKSVVTSSLTKAAVFGHDANWGRILCALGYSGVGFRPETVDISVESANGRVDMAVNGVAGDYSEDEATDVFDSDHVTIICNMKNGSASATAWGCDLSYDYVKINADYRS